MHENKMWARDDQELFRYNRFCGPKYIQMWKSLGNKVTYTKGILKFSSKIRIYIPHNMLNSTGSKIFWYSQAWDPNFHIHTKELRYRYIWWPFHMKIPGTDSRMMLPEIIRARKVVGDPLSISNMLSTI